MRESQPVFVLQTINGELCSPELTRSALMETNKESSAHGEYRYRCFIRR